MLNDNGRNLVPVNQNMRTKTSDIKHNGRLFKTMNQVQFHHKKQMYQVSTQETNKNY